MSLIVACLLPMITITFLSIILEHNAIMIHTIATGIRILEDIEGLGDIVIPDFELDAIEGALIILGILFTFALVIGIQIFGSGLGETTVRMVLVITAYSGIWAVLTILSFDLIVSIEMFGGVIYLSLTIGYVIGVIEKLSEGG